MHGPHDLKRRTRFAVKGLSPGQHLPQDDAPTEDVAFFRVLGRRKDLHDFGTNLCLSVLN